jgi:hypothetical protein
VHNLGCDHWLVVWFECSFAVLFFCWECKCSVKSWGTVENSGYMACDCNLFFPTPQSTVPRSQPISMKRGGDHTRTAPPDLSSLSPPSVSLLMPFLLKHGCLLIVWYWYQIIQIATWPVLVKFSRCNAFVGPRVWSRFLAADSEDPGSIPGATTFSEKLWVWNGVHSASWV